MFFCFFHILNFDIMTSEGRKKMSKTAVFYTHTHTHTHTHGCLCKIIFSALAVFAIINPSYSTTITGTGNECTETKLNTDTGPVTLQAQWDPNTINIEWYNGDTKITPSNNTANTCEYDGAITLPTNTLTKTGYTFGGWRVREVVAQLFNLATLDPSTPGTASGSSSLNGNAGSNESTYGLTAGSGEWATEFEYGTVKGMARCSTQAGSNGRFTNGVGDNNGNWSNTTKLSTLTDETGQEGARYCWCQATGFDAEKDGTYVSVTPSSWVFNYVYVDADSCANGCAAHCGGYFRTHSNFRAVIYGIT